MRPVTPKRTVVAGSAHERSPLPGHEDHSAGGPGEPSWVAAELVETLVPRWADHAAVHLLDEVCAREERPEAEAARPEPNHGSEHGSNYTVLRRVAVAGGHPRARPPGEILRLPAQSPVLFSLAGGETVHVPHADSFAAEHLAAQLGCPPWTAPLRGSSVLLIPLVADDMLLGNVMVVREPGRPAFEDGSIATMEAVVRWASRCSAGSRSLARQARLVGKLRRGLRPEGPPELADLEFGYRYLPENRTVRIGGDWFDVIALADGRVALVIGDVMGHGVDAAIVMNRCETIVRTLALTGMAPDEVLGRFDRHFAELACRHGDDQIATCLIAIYDPATGRCQVANAGQIPPLLVPPDGRGEVLDIPTGAPIGAAGPAFRTRTFAVRHGSILALCTDGFTTLHHPDIDHALTRVRGTLTDPARPLEEICDSAFHGVDTENRRDDVTLLLARLLGGQAPGQATPRCS